MQQFECFKEAGGIISPRHAVTCEQRIAERIGARERTGVRQRQRRALGRGPRLERDERHPRRARGKAGF